MSDEQTPAPIHVQIAEKLAVDEGLTFAAVLAHGPLVLSHLKNEYPQRYAMLRDAHTPWVQQGRPAATPPTVPVFSEPPRPAPVDPLTTVSLPAPDTVMSLRDLLPLGPAGFNAFKVQHPERYADLARAAGVPVR